MRKTFTDKIDGVYNPGGEGTQSALGNTDWYMFTGVFLTYRIFNANEDCPTYNEKVYSINPSGRSTKKDSWFTRRQDDPGTGKTKKSKKGKR
jgi:hypothetical protein